jgi:hypothetical protein
MAETTERTTPVDLTADELRMLLAGGCYADLLQCSRGEKMAWKFRDALKVISAAPPPREAIYICPYCNLPHPASDAAFWQQHKAAHRGRFL